jgi:HK97 family phage portal protein
MSFLFERRSAPLALQPAGFTIGNNWTGETVTEDSALEVAAVLACVSLLADSVASLPLRAIKQIGDRNEPLAVPAWIQTPAPTVTSYELIHMLVSSLALHGNAYAVLDYAGGLLKSITPLHPAHVVVTVVDSKRTYNVNGVDVPADDMMHLRWFTSPQQAKGISPIHTQRTTIGLSLAMDRHLAQFYGEGATPSSVLETDAEMTVEAAKVLQATWESQHRRRRRPAVLSGGLKWRAVSASAADMELNATREAQIQEIARIFRVPAHMVGSSGPSQTYQNIEQAGVQFVTYTLLPWLRRIEDALSNLMPTPQVVRFDTSAFLRADTINRYRAHQVGISSGFITPNEARNTEGLEPFVGGDEFFLALPGAPMAGPGVDLPPVGVDADPPQ